MSTVVQPPLTLCLHFLFVPYEKWKDNCEDECHQTLRAAQELSNIKKEENWLPIWSNCERASAATGSTMALTSCLLHIVATGHCLPWLPSCHRCVPLSSVFLCLMMSSLMYGLWYYQNKLYTFWNTFSLIYYLWSVYGWNQSVAKRFILHYIVHVCFL